MASKAAGATIYSNVQKEAVGIRVVETFVREPWDCLWQEFDARNDKGIDGVIIMRRGNTETGGIVFVQVKCGGNGYRADQKKHPDRIGVKLGEAYLNGHKPRWNAMPGPCVIVFVDDTEDRKNPPAWWGDLKDPSIYSSTNKHLLLLPKAQRFGSHSKGDFHRLCGTGPIDKVLPLIEAMRQDLIVPKGKETLRQAARGFYKQWSTLSFPTTNPTLGEVLVNRVGWRHITNQSRLVERQMQSLTLIGIARRMIDELNDIDMLGRARVTDCGDGWKKVVDHLGIRANVLFPHRHQSVVLTVLRRERLISANADTMPQQKIWFLSVYELRRGVNQN
ncbi:DUF4365 domain-containing protein [Allopusillimonas ginsengisoli]|nr:DUF4365 domain-containing protein [Allopusillimonas ginsengisoli]